MGVSSDNPDREGCAPAFDGRNPKLKATSRASCPESPRPASFLRQAQQELNGGLQGRQVVRNHPGDGLGINGAQVVVSEDVAKPGDFAPRNVRGSQIHRLAQHVFAHVAVEFVLGDEFDAAAQLLLKLLGQWQTLAEHVVAGRQIDQQVDVAAGGFLPPRHRAEDPDAPSTIAPAERRDGVSLGVQFIEQHGGDGTANAMPLRAAPGARSSPRG